MGCHERPIMAGGELVPGLGLWRDEPAKVPASDLLPSRDEFVAVMNRACETFDGVREMLERFIREMSRIMGPPIRHMARHVKLRTHRRHQDERRCMAKAGRRERTGWRQRA